MIRVEGVSVAFGRTLALDNVVLSFEPGVTGLFGPNGSGKSTLLRVIAGLLRPSAGSVTIDEADVRSETIRRRIGYCGHSSGLYRDLTLQENLELVAGLYGTAPDRATAVVEALGLAPFASIRVGDLSAGLARRAAVARALVHVPDVLLLDEPYANVDEEAAELMSAALREGQCPDGIVVVATHGAKRIKAFADAGVILRDGRIVTAGRYHRREKVG